MIRVIVCCLGLLIAVPVAAQSPAAIEQQIRDLEQKYNAAYAANDLPTYFSYLADDFGQWLPSGRTDKASYQTSWTRFITGGGKVLSAELSDVQVKVSPAADTAVVSYLLHVKTQSSRGTADETYQETDVWFKRNNQWNVLSLPVPPPPPLRNQQE
jgi:ketosteroid isomerase-like protein